MCIVLWRAHSFTVNTAALEKNRELPNVAFGVRRFLFCRGEYGCGRSAEGVNSDRLNLASRKPLLLLNV